MQDIKQTRRRFSVILTVLLCIDVAAIGVLLSPIGRSSRGGQAQLKQLWSEFRAKDREVIPLHGIDKKVVQAKDEISAFYADHFPENYAGIADQLGKLATDSGVKITGIKYATKPAPVNGLDRVIMQLSISGDYLQEIKFINALEREKTFFLIDGINLQEAGKAEGGVQLQLELETYLKSA